MGKLNPVIELIGRAVGAISAAKTVKEVVSPSKPKPVSFEQPFIPDTSDTQVEDGLKRHFETLSRIAPRFAQRYETEIKDGYRKMRERQQEREESL